MSGLRDAIPSGLNATARISTATARKVGQVRRLLPGRVACWCSRARDARCGSRDGCPTTVAILRCAKLPSARRTGRRSRNGGRRARSCGWRARQRRRSAGNGWRLSRDCGRRPRNSRWRCRSGRWCSRNRWWRTRNCWRCARDCAWRLRHGRRRGDGGGEICPEPVCKRPARGA